MHDEQFEFTLEYVGGTEARDHMNAQWTQFRHPRSDMRGSGPALRYAWKRCRAPNMWKRSRAAMCAKIFLASMKTQNTMIQRIPRRCFLPTGLSSSRLSEIWRKTNHPYRFSCFSIFDLEENLPTDTFQPPMRKATNFQVSNTQIQSVKIKRGKLFPSWPKQKGEIFHPFSKFHLFLGEKKHCSSYH